MPPLGEGQIKFLGVSLLHLIQLIPGGVHRRKTTAGGNQLLRGTILHYGTLMNYQHTISTQNR